MTQEERWNIRYGEVKTFIETNKRNPSKYDAKERGRYVNWLRHNRKLYNLDVLKMERVERFEELFRQSKQYRRKNQNA